MRNLHKRRLLVALKGCRPVYMRAPSYSAIAIISRTMANCSCASDTSTPSDVTNWLATPAPFNAEKHGARAVFSGDDSSVVERREPDDHCDGGVAYTASPLPLGHVWQITLLNTTGRQWGFGLRFGVTSALPKTVPRCILANGTASSKEWLFDGQQLYHHLKEADFPHLPSLDDLSPGDSVGLLVTASGDLHIFFNGSPGQRVATGLPVNNDLWGVVDVCYNCYKIKSEMLSGESLQLQDRDDQLQHQLPKIVLPCTNKEISDRDLAIIAQDHLTDWKALRPFLGLSHSQVTEILQSYPTDYQKQKHKCLIMWKETQGHEATYCALIRAAEDAQAQSLADGVRSVQPPTHSPHSQGRKTTHKKEGSPFLDQIPLSVKSQMITTPPHHYFDEDYPSIRFLGKPAEFVVTQQQEAVTLSPPGHGVSIMIPQDALRPDEPMNISFKTCLSGDFKFPEGYEPFSSVYHITTDRPFEKEVELSIEHFAHIKTDEQVKDMTFFVAKPVKGSKEIEFTAISGGKFEVGKESCVLSTRTFSFWGVGTKANKIQRRYTVLCSYSNESADVQRAAVAVCVDAAAYIKNFREAVEKEWKVSVSHRSKLNVSFKDPTAYVEYPTHLNGWDIFADSSDCSTEVDYSRPDDLAIYDYPPRFFFEINPSTSAESCTLKLTLMGMESCVDFLVSLRGTKHVYMNESRRPTGTTERPNMVTLGTMTTRSGETISIIDESATAYRQIGSILLQDRYGRRVEVIESDEQWKSKKVMREIYKQWISEDEHHSWAKLTDCLRQCHLNSLAYDLELHFGLPLPLLMREESPSMEIIRQKSPVPPPPAAYDRETTPTESELEQSTSAPRDELTPAPEAHTAQDEHELQPISPPQNHLTPTHKPEDPAPSHSVQQRTSVVEPSPTHKLETDYPISEPRKELITSHDHTGSKRRKWCPCLCF